jgi:hypothetical protein
MSAAKRLVGLLAGVVLLCAGAALAVENIVLTIARVDGGTWSASDLTVALDLVGAEPAVKLRIAEATLPGVSQPVRDVSVECAALEISMEAYRCQRAQVQLSAPHVGRQRATADIRYARASGALDVNLSGLDIARGSAAANLALGEKKWTARVSVKGARADDLIKLAEIYGGLEAPLSAGSGSVTASATLSGSDRQVHDAALRGRIEALTVNNASGSIASEKLSLDASARLNRAGAAWRFELEVGSKDGQAYVEPIFLDLGQHPVSLAARGALRAGKSVTLELFSLDHADAVQARGSAIIDLELEQPLRSLDLTLAAVRFPGAFESYAQPWLLDTGFRELQTSGVISGHVQVVDGAPRSVDLTLDDLTLDDGAQRLALRGLDGRIRWRDEEEADSEAERAASVGAPAPSSSLRWRSGAMLGLAIGGARLSFHAAGRSFRLLEPTRIPLLDGAVDVETFRVRSAGTPKVAFLVDASLQPISTARLCQAFGWPEFGGQLSGQISKLRMREGVVTMGATLQAQVFDGSVSISDLRLEEPFGQWPKLHSSIALDRLDLEHVTSAFSFGRITGRLSGAIDELQLFNWTPVAFDARFFTPPNDRSRRRISQRAVQNIGAIGGGGAGVTAALSSGFLRFFEDFNYDRLGLSCRLRNEVCEMNGVGPAPNGGYYLVQGKGVPRIDVIGNSRRVDWPRLVQQLIAITESEGPVVR